MPLQKAVHNQIGNAGAEGRLISFQCFHCVRYLFGSVGGTSKSTHAHPLPNSLFLNHILGVYVGEYQYSLDWIVFQNLPSCIDAIKLWHADVQNEKVWLKLRTLFYCFPSVSGLSANRPSFMRTKQ